MSMAVHRIGKTIVLDGDPMMHPAQRMDGQHDSLDGVTSGGGGTGRVAALEHCRSRSGSFKGIAGTDKQ